jgi:hypothetical protein
MDLMLRLVGIGTDGPSRSFDVMAISRPDGLGDIANLGMSLAVAQHLTRIWRDLDGSSSNCVVALAVSRTAEDHLS